MALAVVALALVAGAQLVAGTLPDAISLGVLAVSFVAWGTVLVWLLRHLALELFEAFAFELDKGI